VRLRELCYTSRRCRHPRQTLAGRSRRQLLRVAATAARHLPVTALRGRVPDLPLVRQALSPGQVAAASCAWRFSWVQEGESTSRRGRRRPPCCRRAAAWLEQGSPPRPSAGRLLLGDDCDTLLDRSGGHGWRQRGPAGPGRRLQRRRPRPVAQTPRLADAEACTPPQHLGEGTQAWGLSRAGSASMAGPLPDQAGAWQEAGVWHCMPPLAADPRDARHHHQVRCCLHKAGGLGRSVTAAAAVLHWAARDSAPGFPLGCGCARHGPGVATAALGSARSAPHAASLLSMPWLRCWHAGQQPQQGAAARPPAAAAQGTGTTPRPLWPGFPALHAVSACEGPPARRVLHGRRCASMPRPHCLATGIASSSTVSAADTRARCTASGGQVAACSGQIGCKALAGSPGARVQADQPARPSLWVRGLPSAAYVEVLKVMACRCMALVL